MNRQMLAESVFTPAGKSQYAKYCQQQANIKGYNCHFCHLFPLQLYHTAVATNSKYQKQ